jgi:hypothetical protein
MLSSHLTLHRRLDELALDALGPPVQLPVKLASDSDISIEVIWEDEAAIDELAATGRFVRFSAASERVEHTAPYERVEYSAPYERVELSSDEMPALSTLAVTFKRSRPTTFVRTISEAERSPQSRATVPFERVWFDDDEDKLAAIEETPVEAKGSWWWLAISLALGGAAVVWMASL